MHAVRHVLTIIAVERYREVVDFYRAAFAWPASVETPVYTELALPGGGRLGIYERVAFGRNTGRPPALLPTGALAPVELYFHTSDLDAAIARVVAAGAPTLSPRSMRAWGDEAAYFADPAGNVLVLARATPSDG